MMDYRDNGYYNDDTDGQSSAQNTQDDSSTSSVTHTVTPPVQPILAFGSARIARDRDDIYANEQYNDDDDQVDSLAIKLQEIELMPLTKDIDIYENSDANGIITYYEVLSTLTNEQRMAIDKIVGGVNLYIRGNPGTGKSYLLLKLKLILERMNKTSVFLAPTGISAENIGGVTIHSYFNIDAKKPYYFKKTDIEKPDVIVIDEVSMLSGELFDIVNHKAKRLWGDDTAMGGTQVILVGDFYQLPPVDDTKTSNQKRKRNNMDCPHTRFGNRGFAFQSKVWSDLELHHITLTEAKRQTDPEFYEVLNSIRRGKLEDVHYKRLQQSTIKPLKRLFCTNEKVDRFNIQEYSRRNKDSHEEKYYRAIIQHQDIRIDKDQKNVLKLKIGVEVYLNVNLKLHSPPYLVNGSRGTVRAFMSTNEVIAKLMEEKQSILNNNHLEDYITCLIEVLTTARDLELTSSYPVVEFKDQNGHLFRRCILPFRKNESNRYEVELPLTYSWAITIHKSQGLSFDSLTIDLDGCQELASAYVALSRCKDASRLFVENINVLKRVIKKGPDQRVTNFYENDTTEPWADDISDHFEVSDDSKFKCIHCEGSSKACYENANPKLSKVIIEKMSKRPKDDVMEKIMACLYREECETLDDLIIAKKSLTEDFLRAMFTKEGIPSRSKEDAISAILEIIKSK